MATLKPIRFEFPDATLERLARRLDDAHLPEAPIVPDAGWTYGTELGKLKQILADWKSGAPARSDGSHAEGGGVQKWWKGVEKRINRCVAGGQRMCEAELTCAMTDTRTSSSRSRASLCTTRSPGRRIRTRCRSSSGASAEPCPPLATLTSPAQPRLAWREHCSCCNLRSC